MPDPKSYTANRLQNLKDRQGLLNARDTLHTWRSILSEADLNYNATMVQFSTGKISTRKLDAIQKEIERREFIEDIQPN